MMSRVYVLLLVLCDALAINFFICAEPVLWASSYRMQVSRVQRDSSALVFSKIDIAPFTQLLFTWNAIRPTKGYFSFSVQTRDAQAQTWGAWHHAVDWGADVQRSYLTPSDGTTEYAHVRLEAAPGKKQDGFRIRVDSVEGVPLEYVKFLAVSVADYTQFFPEKSEAISLPAVYVHGVPLFSQMASGHPEFARICSPTSYAMLISFLKNKRIDPALFARGVFDAGLSVFGSWPFNAAHAFEQSDGNVFFYTKRLNNFAELHAQLQRRIPVVVSVRGALSGAPKSYDQGHLLVVVGWNSKRRMVICHDPAMQMDEQVIKQYPIESFLKAWERSHRLAYWVEQRLKNR